MSTANKITYHDFTALVAKRADVTAAEADTYIHQLAKSIGHALEGGREVPLYHFGRFLLPHVDERQGRDPGTGEAITIPAHTSVHFRPYGALRIAVNLPFRHLRTRLLAEGETGRLRDKKAWFILGLGILALVLLGAGLVYRISARNAGTELPGDAQAGLPVLATVVIPAVIPKVETGPTGVASNAGVGVHPGDSLWTMAATQYGDAAWWPVIYAENKAHLALQNPDLIEIGSAMRMPLLERSAKNPSIADLALKSRAFQIVADDYTQLGHRRALEYREFAAK